MKGGTSVVVLTTAVAVALASAPACDLEIRCHTDDNCPRGEHCVDGLCGETREGAGGADASGGGGGAPSCGESGCSAGTYCSPDQTCLPCEVDGHCGPSCVACGGSTPVCDGTVCVACLPDGADCPTGQHCDSEQTCQQCDTDDHCGDSCAPCSGLTPVCDGNTCVECLVDIDCPVAIPCCVDKVCSLGLC